MSNNILKLIIVDDEYLVRDLFKRCLSWHDLGLCIAGEAAGAREALEIIGQELPDVVFTDICMPSMDGIELSRIIRDKYPWVKIVILTGHEEFDYAKRSIRAGVADFLLKPINDQEIKKVVLELREKILAERAERDEYRRLKKQLTENLPYLKEKFFNELLQKKVDGPEVRDKLNYFKIEFPADLFQTAVLEILPDNPDDHPGTEEQIILGMQGMDLIGEYYGQKGHIDIFFDYQQRIVAINNDPAMDMTEWLDSVKILLQSQLHCGITIGVGRSYRGLENIHFSYREAVDALNYKLVIGKGQIISYSDLDLLPRGSGPANFQDEEFTFFIKAGCGEKAVNRLDLFFTEISIDPVLNVDSLRAKAFMIVALLLNAVDGLGLRAADVFVSGNGLYDQLLRIDTLPEMKEYLTGLVLTATVTVKNLHVKKESGITKNVQEYLIQNMANESLSLTKVAKEFYLNPSYLSRIFKQTTGTTFVEFLTRIRMESAIKFLREADKKAYQIGEAVGIPDPHYFGICFKKYTGMSINEFRKS